MPTLLKYDVFFVVVALVAIEHNCVFRPNFLGILVGARTGSPSLRVQHGDALRSAPPAARQHSAYSTWHDGHGEEQNICERRKNIALDLGRVF
jgi:hypothetical protein